MTDIIHENENYKVVVLIDWEWLDENGNVYETNYAVVNKTTEVMEFFSPQLSAALFNAESFNSIIIEEPHMWQAEQRMKKVGNIIEGALDNDAQDVH